MWCSFQLVDTGNAGQGFTPHVISVAAGEVDIYFFFGIARDHIHMHVCIFAHAYNIQIISVRGLSRLYSPCTRAMPCFFFFPY